MADQRVNGNLILIGSNGGTIALGCQPSGGGFTILLPTSIPQVGQSLVITSVFNGNTATAQWGAPPGITSVAFSAPGIFAVSGTPIPSIPSWSSVTSYIAGQLVNYLGLTYTALSPNSNQQPNISPSFWAVTSSGIISLSLVSQNANSFWAGPTLGAASAPTFRSIVVNDLFGGTGASNSTFLRGDGTWAVPADTDNFVTSVFGRGPGAVVAQSGDYSYSQISGTPQLPITPVVPTHNFLNGYSSVSGVFSFAQPSVADLSNGTTGSGSIVLATSPSISGATLSGSTSITGTSTFTTANPTFFSATGTGAVVLATSPTITSASLAGTTAITNVHITGTLADGTNSVGTSGQVLTSTVTGVQWASAASGTIGGSIAAGQIAVGSGANAISGSSALTYSGGTLTVNATNGVAINSSGGSSAITLSDTGTGFSTWIKNAGVSTSILEMQAQTNGSSTNASTFALVGSPGAVGGASLILNNGSGSSLTTTNASGRITLSSAGGLLFQNTFTGTTITNSGNGGTQLTDSGTGGMIIQTSGGGGMLFENTDTGASSLQIANTGTGGTSVTDSGGGGFVLTVSGASNPTNVGSVGIGNTGPLGIVLQDDGGGGILLEATSDFAITYSITSVNNHVGGFTTYNGTFPALNLGANNFAVISGFTNLSNNGQFGIQSSTSTTLTVANPNGVAETHAATMHEASYIEIINQGSGGMFIEDSGGGGIALSAGSASITANSNLKLSSTLTDGTGSVGTSGQVLSSTVTGTQWVAVSGGPQVSQVTVSNAQLLALNGTTSHQLLPAPGSGKAYFILQAMLEYNAGSAGYVLNNALDNLLNICTAQTFSDANTNAEWENALSVQLPTTGPYNSGNFGNFLSFNTPTGFNFDITTTRSGIIMGAPGVNFPFGSFMFATPTELNNQPLVLALSQGQSAASGSMTGGTGSTLVVTICYTVINV